MIKLTDTAIDRLSYLAEQNNSKYVRLSVKGGGCAGYEYEWSFDNNDTKAFIIGMVASMAAVIAWDVVKRSFKIFNYAEEKKIINKQINK